jgi:hypothetical protein
MFRDPSGVKTPEGNTPYVAPKGATHKAFRLFPQGVKPCPDAAHIYCDAVSYSGVRKGGSEPPHSKGGVPRLWRWGFYGLRAQRLRAGLTCGAPAALGLAGTTKSEGVVFDSEVGASLACSNRGWL